MLIHELAQQTGVAAKTIRYYESIRLMPPPQRGANNYRQYTTADAERIRFIASARSLGFSLRDVADILMARDAGIAPCDRVLQTIDQKIIDVDRRIADLLRLRGTLAALHRSGAVLTRDDVHGEQCICSLLKAYRSSDELLIGQSELADDQAV